MQGKATIAGHPIPATRHMVLNLLVVGTERSPVAR